MRILDVDPAGAEPRFCEVATLPHRMWKSTVSVGPIGPFEHARVALDVRVFARGGVEVLVWFAGVAVRFIKPGQA